DRLSMAGVSFLSKEFKNTGYGEEPTIHLKNYIKNRAIENIAPEIANSIDKIGDFINSLDKKLTPAIDNLSRA
ncbi:unnamed protein product, partial [marine sediment metagenome]